jgi:hypothetical protein
MSTSIEALSKEFTKFKTEFTEKAKDAMRVAFKEFFEANPDIDQIAWTQYTPYFNDGDACVFGVNEMGFTLAKDKVDLSEVDYPDEEGNFYESSFWNGEGKYTDPVSEYRKLFSAFVGQVTSLPDEIFLNAFGDHVRVIANKDGFDVQEYSHD